MAEVMPWRTRLSCWRQTAVTGWRQYLRQRSFLPHMIVAHALPLAATGGTMGRPGPEVPGLPGLYVAGTIQAGAFTFRPR